VPNFWDEQCIKNGVHCRWRFWVDLIALVPLDYVVLSLADNTDQGHWLVYANCARILRMVSRPPYAGMQRSSYFVICIIPTRPASRHST